MDPIHLCVALIPLSTYLAFLAAVNLRRQATVISGALDLLAVVLGLAGLVAVGPMELFWPDSAAARYGPVVWGLLLGLYGLGAILAALVMRPRLVIYNVQSDEVLEVLRQASPQIDPQARLVGDTLALPGLRVQLHVEPFPPLRNVQLVSSGPRQNLDGWMAVAAALRRAFADRPTSSNPYGYSLLLFASTLSGVVVYTLCTSPSQVIAGFWQMLRLHG